MEILPGVHQITKRGVNLVLIAEEKLTLIDTGFRGIQPVISRYLKKIGRFIEELNLIVITHNHLDHAGGLAELLEVSGARVAIHRDDLSEMESGLPYPDIALKALRFPPISLFKPLAYAEPGQIELKLKGGEILNPLGGIEVIHTPGHTPGSISIYAASKKLLIVGDTLNHRLPRLRLPPKSVSSSIPQAITSIKRLAHLDIEILCFGHGRPILRGAKAAVEELLMRRGLYEAD